MRSGQIDPAPNRGICISCDVPDIDLRGGSQVVQILTFDSLLRQTANRFLARPFDMMERKKLEQQRRNACAQQMGTNAEWRSYDDAFKELSSEVSQKGLHGSRPFRRDYLRELSKSRIFLE